MTSPRLLAASQSTRTEAEVRKTREIETVYGNQLREGDTLADLWFIPGGRDRLVSLAPYDGPLKHLFPKGAQLAAFACSPTGMTIDNSSLYRRVRN